MRWKEASKVRKLKSLIRSRKLQDMSRKKLHYEGRSNQLQTDYLHHTQGKVMTRKQIDTVKQKMSGGEEVKGRGRDVDRQKVKLEREKEDRAKRLEKRSI